MELGCFVFFDTLSALVPLPTSPQICEFPINKQDEIRRAYLKKGPYQPKNIDYPYSNDTHRHRFQPSNWPPHVQIPGYAPGCNPEHNDHH